MPRVQIDGAALWYEFVGDGETVVQIHGGGFGHENFAFVTPLIAEHYRVLDFDMRGYGASDRPPDSPYTMKMWSDDTVALMDALGIEKAHVHGTSMGGMVAQQFALDHPERVDALVLTCTACRMDYAGWLTFEVWIRILENIGVEDDSLAMLLALQGLTRDYLDAEGHDVVDTIRRTVASACSPEVFAAACRAMQGIDYIDRLAEISAPTLVLTGADDEMTPVEYAPSGGGSRRIAELIPRAELQLLSNAGHTHLFQKPEESARIILDFLSRQQGREGAVRVRQPE
jgi:pimeloyl-ACP methyl ester carboxylesterase